MDTQLITRAMQTIIAKSESQQAQDYAMQAINAATAKSPAIQHRLNVVVQMALSAPNDFNADDRALLASVVNIADENDTLVKSVRFTQAELAQLEMNMADGENISQYIRRKALA